MGILKIRMLRNGGRSISENFQIHLLNAQKGCYLVKIIYEKGIHSEKIHIY